MDCGAAGGAGAALSGDLHLRRRRLRHRGNRGRGGARRFDDLVGIGQGIVDLAIRIGRRHGKRDHVENRLVQARFVNDSLGRVSLIRGRDIRTV